MEQLIRKSGASGKYYSGKKNILEREVAVFLESSPEVQIPNRVYGLIVPNSEYIASGAVAARAYRQIIDKEFDYVVILTSPRHTYFEEISFYEGDSFETPIGVVETDKEIINQITEQHPQLIKSTLGHEMDEFGIEIQLPLLQQALYDFKLVPVMMGNQDPDNIEILTNALTKVFSDKNVLFIASSNLSTGHEYSKASLMDKIAVDYIEKFNADSLIKDFDKGMVEMTDGGAIISVMKTCAALGAEKSKVLLYRNSGDIGLNREDVTGYVSAVLYS